MDGRQTSLDPAAALYEPWNRGDASAVAAAFAPEGTYLDPLCGRALAGAELAGHVSHLLQVFPGGRFTVGRVLEDAGGLAVAWTFEGPCQGEIDAELKGHGATVRLSGMDLLDRQGAAIVRLQRFFDRRALADALGLQTIVEPIADGSMTFGYSLRDWSSKEQPGALGLTWLLARDEAEKVQIRKHSRGIIRHFHQVDGFIGIVTGFAGLHGFTVTAWRSEDALLRGTRAGPHAEAKRAFSEGLSGGVFTSVWTPLRLNRMWSRCPNGHANNATRADGRCERCGEPLPAPEPYL